MQRISSSIPVPFSADTRTVGSSVATPAICLISEESRSALFSATIIGQPPAPISSNTCSTALIWLSMCGLAASTTCTSRSASATSSNVARKAATRTVGRRCTNPTVSVRRNSWPPVSRTRRVIGSSVAKSLSSAMLLVLLVVAKRLSNVDLPAFV